mmetsp:Transcript_8935/g.13332  ORF Transcript_8935/g.13332 Transcript_8935/m.13332 type:complete len:379 (+) Transcript_8935:733-1869(+)
MRQARGTSIMVPTLNGTRWPRSWNTFSAVSRMRLSWWTYSATVPTRGTMIWGCGSLPRAFTSKAASTMALVCIAVISGEVIPRRHPRSPSMGLSSLMCSMTASSCSTLMPTVAATAGSGWEGRNSWRGGSRRRMVTGSPVMASKMPSKAVLWSGRRSARARSLASWFSARIMRRTSGRWSKNMCSVRQRPMPWAPFFRASMASSGESALAKTSRSLMSSTHCMKVPRWPSKPGLIIGKAPVKSSPVLPLSEMRSPSLISLPPITACFFSSSMSSSPIPQMQVLPHPRATTAAWEVIPPRAVRIPAAACMPPTSSAEVSSRIRIALVPLAKCASTSSVVKAATPTAAPGEAGRPFPRTELVYTSEEVSSNCGCSMMSRC